MVRHLNLLPIERREHLRRGVLMVSSVRILRTILLGLSLLTGGALCIGFGLWGLTLSYSKVGSQELALQVNDYQKLKNEITEQNQLLDMVDQLGRERVVWSDYLSSLIEVVPPSTVINGINADATSRHLDFIGEALARNSLVVFEDRLSQLEWVETVIASNQNLLQKSKPKYSFSLKLKQSEENIVSKAE